MKFFNIGVILLGAMCCVIDSQLIVRDYDSHNSERNERNQFSTNNSSQLGSRVLKDIHAKAKNISRSKGPIVNIDGKDPEFRRSLIRKIELKTNSLAVKKVLNILQNCTDEDMVPTLEALKLLVHEYDTAINFMNIGGMELIVPLVQMADEKIASAALSVLSAAMQGNPVVQKLASENNILNVLLANLAGKGGNYFSSLLFTISSYLRNMPESQIHFFQNDGIFFLADIIESNSSMKLRLHSIAILADLASEIMEDSNINYQKMQLIKLFISGVKATHVCKEITSFLYGVENNNNPETVHSEYLVHEKIIHAMSALHAICAREFQSNQVKSAIEKLILKYDPQVKLSWYSKIDNELKMSIHLELKKIYEQMYSEENLKKVEL